MHTAYSDLCGRFSDQDSVKNCMVQAYGVSGLRSLDRVEGLGRPSINSVYLKLSGFGVPGNGN